MDYWSSNRLASEIRKLSTNLYRFLYNIFCGHFWAFQTSSRPLYGHSRPLNFHGHPTFFMATFEQSGRGHGHLATLDESPLKFLRRTCVKNLNKIKDKKFAGLKWVKVKLFYTVFRLRLNFFIPYFVLFTRTAMAVADHSQYHIIDNR